jgi:hypothetical protein
MSHICLVSLKIWDIYGAYTGGIGRNHYFVYSCLFSFLLLALTFNTCLLVQICKLAYSRGLGEQPFINGFCYEMENTIASSCVKVSNATYKSVAFLRPLVAEIADYTCMGASATGVEEKVNT